MLSRVEHETFYNLGTSVIDIMTDASHKYEVKHAIILLVSVIKSIISCMKRKKRAEKR